MTRARVLLLPRLLRATAVICTMVIVAAASAGASSADTTRRIHIAVLGDSITAAWGAIGDLLETRAESWSAGTIAAVNSHRSRLAALRSPRRPPPFSTRSTTRRPGSRASPISLCGLVAQINGSGARSPARTPMEPPSARPITELVGMNLDYVTIEGRADMRPRHVRRRPMLVTPAIRRPWPTFRPLSTTRCWRSSQSWRRAASSCSPRSRTGTSWSKTSRQVLTPSSPVRTLPARFSSKKACPLRFESASPEDPSSRQGSRQRVQQRAQDGCAALARSAGTTAARCTRSGSRSGISRRSTTSTSRPPASRSSPRRPGTRAGSAAAIRRLRAPRWDRP